MHKCDFLIRYDVEADNAKSNSCQTIPKEKAQVKDHQLPVVVFENLGACTGCLPNAGIRRVNQADIRAVVAANLDRCPNRDNANDNDVDDKEQGEGTAAYIIGGAEGKQRNQTDQCNGAYDNQPAQRTNADAQAQFQRGQIGFSAGKRLENQTDR